MLSTDCIYFNNSGTCNSGRCSKKFNRNKQCVLTRLKRCGHKRLTETYNPIFDDPKWFWKSSMHTLLSAVDSLFYGEQRKFYGKKGEAHANRRRKIGHYPFIMRDMGSVMRMLIYARKYLGDCYSNPKFLDCGCGVGNTVIMAHFAGFNAYGIEYDPVTLQRGRRLLKQFGIDPKKLFRGDILEYPNYADYDVLYGYCPMCDDRKEHIFENKLKFDMKIGALLCGLNSGRQRYQKIGKERVYFKRLTLDSDAAYSWVNPSVKVDHEKE